MSLMSDMGTAVRNEILKRTYPTGAIAAFAMTTPPVGWLECNGSAISRTIYEDLFEAIGTTFGAGDGVTTFNLPDLRGEFIRGFDNGRGIDAGRAFGSSQADELKSHTHSNVSVNGSSADNGAPGNYILTAATQFNALTNVGGGVGATGGSETRPRNIALKYCIKAYGEVLNEGVLDIVKVLDYAGTMAALRLTTGTENNQAIELLGYYTAGDGGGGTFYWDATSTETDNGGTIIQATGITTGRWKRVFSGAVNVKWFGAKGNGVADDTVAIQNSLYCKSSVFVPNGRYRIANTIEIPSSICIYGDTFSSGFVNDGTAIGNNTLTDCSVLLLENIATLLCEKESYIKNITIHNINTPAPQANPLNFYGKAITITGHGVSIENVYLLGFEYGIYSDNYASHTIMNVKIDCINGVYIKDCYDTCRIENIHATPLLTMVPSVRDNNTNSLDNSRMRKGVAFYFDGVGDWNKATNCISFSWQFGFRIKDCYNVTLLNCGADNLNEALSVMSNTFGIYVEGGANYIVIDNFTSAGKNFAIKSFIPVSNNILITNSNIKDCTVGILNMQGIAQIYNNRLIGGFGGSQAIAGDMGYINSTFIKNNIIEGWGTNIQQYVTVSNADAYNYNTSLESKNNLPYGTIVASGSNSNGNYIRYADGTQICTSLRNAPITSPHTWVYPVPFVSVPILTGTLSSYAGTYYNGLWYAFTGTSLTQGQYYFNTTIPTTISIQSIAIGRWK